MCSLSRFWLWQKGNTNNKKKVVSLAPPMIEEINAKLNIFRWKRGRPRFSPHQWITRMTHSWLLQEILAGWWLVTSHQRPVQMSNYLLISPALRSMTSLRLKRHFNPFNGCDGNKRNQFEKAGTIHRGADLFQNYQSGPNLGGFSYHSANIYDWEMIKTPLCVRKGPSVTIGVNSINP